MNLDQLSNYCPSDYNDFIPEEFSIEDKYTAFNNNYIFDSHETAEFSKDFDKFFEEKFQQNFNPYFCIKLEEKENENEKHLSNYNIFKVKKYEKRGRKKNFLKKKRKTHCKTDDDNVLRKIQVHFFTFLINFTNDILKVGFPTKDSVDNIVNFRQIKYEDKSNITKKNIKELESCSIKDILNEDISSKFEKSGKNHNEIDYKEIREQISNNKSLSWIQKFFDMNYFERFRKFYYKFKKENIMMFQGKEIIFSEKAKSFYDLLEKNEERIKKRLIIISERYLKREKNMFITNNFRFKKELY